MRRENTHQTAMQMLIEFYMGKSQMYKSTLLSSVVHGSTFKFCAFPAHLASPVNERGIWLVELFYVGGSMCNF